MSHPRFQPRVSLHRNIRRRLFPEEFEPVLQGQVFGEGKVRVGGQDRLGGLAGLVQEASVEGAVDPGHLRQTALARADEVPRAAQLQVLLRQQKAIAGLDHRLEALFADRGRLIREQ